MYPVVIVGAHNLNLRLRHHLGVPPGTTLIYAVGINLGVPLGTTVHSLYLFTVLGQKKTPFRSLSSFIQRMEQNRSKGVLGIEIFLRLSGG